MERLVNRCDRPTQTTTHNRVQPDCGRRRGVGWRLLTAIVPALLASIATGQDPPHTVAPAVSPAAVAEQPPEHLRLSSEGVLDKDATPAQRRRHATQLLLDGSPHGQVLLVDLLSRADRPDVQLAVCAVIAERAVTQPALIGETLADPLIALLDAEQPALRTLAARALADFPNGQVTQKLGAVAGGADTPLTMRLAAVDALAPNIHRRGVVAQLVVLLDSGVPQITARVYEALEPAARAGLGHNPEAWRDWWAQKAKLNHEDWLKDRVGLLHARVRRLESQSRQYHQEVGQSRSELALRVGDLQRELYRLLSPDQQDSKLASWLRDEQLEVAQSALSIVRSRITEDGYRAGGEVLAGLLALLEADATTLRRETLRIVQNNVNDSDVVAAILARFEVEQDPATRHAVLQALGHLDNPVATPALVREIASTEASPQCIREASLALGQLAARAPDRDALAPAVVGLKQRLADVPADNVAYRADLLVAMAGVADPSFGLEFAAAIDSDTPGLLRPAVHYFAALRDRSEMPRLRALMSHTDDLVRLSAIEAVGQLGRDDADLGELLQRLNPTVEQMGAARDAAWDAFRAVLGLRSVAEQIDWASRLRELPGRESSYLQGLEQRMAGGDSRADELELVRVALVDVYIAQEQFADAVPRLHELFDFRLEHRPMDAFETGLRWLDASLRASNVQDRARIIEQLVTVAATEDARTRIVQAVAQHIDSDEALNNTERAQALLADLQSAQAEPLGQAWSDLLQRLAERIESIGTPAANGP